MGVMQASQPHARPSFWRLADEPLARGSGDGRFVARRRHGAGKRAVAVRPRKMRQGRRTGLEKIWQQRHRMAHGAVATLGAAWVMRLAVDACTGRFSASHRSMRNVSAGRMGVGVGVGVGACEFRMPVTGLRRLLCSLRRAGQNQSGRHGITRPRAPGQQDN